MMVMRVSISMSAAAVLQLFHVEVLDVVGDLLGVLQGDAGQVVVVVLVLVLDLARSGQRLVQPSSSQVRDDGSMSSRSLHLLEWSLLLQPGVFRADVGRDHPGVLAVVIVFEVQIHFSAVFLEQGLVVE